MKKMMVYGLLCTTVWCAAISFFEGVIMAYATAGDGDRCPIPKRGTDAMVMDCFIYEHSFDPSPVNRRFPEKCNFTTPLSFNGNWAGCFGWIYNDVEVVEVIDALGVCTGIVAFIGGAAVLIGFLCQKHRWRLVFDITATLLIPGAIYPLIRFRGHVPFLTYVLLTSLAHIIVTTEYFLKRVPLSTILCTVKMVYKYTKYRLRSKYDA